MKSYLKLPVLLLVAAWAPPSTAATVTELAPDELAKFVHHHARVAVQFTSPDRKCTYCYTADDVFDQAAAASTDRTLVFARVQWPEYYQVPNFKPLFENIFAVPAQMLFKDGRLHGRANGHPVTAELLLGQFADILRGPPKPHQVGMVRMPEPAAQPLTQGEMNQIELEFRRVYLGKVLANCSKRFPDDAPGYEAAFDAWHERRKPELERARLTMAAHTGAADSATIRQIFERGHKAMGVLQVQTLRVPSNRDPLPEECARVIDGIVALP